MKIKFLFLITATLLSLSVLEAVNYKVNDISQYKEKVKILQPGDSLILANGIWKDVEFQFKGNGTEGKYIYLTAETRGKVRIEGSSRLQLSGNYLHISGLVFANGHGSKSAVIEFRTSSKDYAYNSVLSECVIDKFNQPVKDSADHWVGIYGKKNTVEYCYFGGKTNLGTTLVVWPNDSNSINNNHLIYRNYFGPRPRLGSNGGETIRIGTSQVCTNSSGTIVEGNYFERCNGEVEIISNKSCDNKFTNNTFLECEGTLTLRHGNRATVSGNWFLGNGKENTGGVRIINEGHLVYNNYFYKLRGDEFRSGLTIMNGIPNTPANGYLAVKNVVVANNTFYDCAFPMAFGAGFGERDRTVRPETTLLLNNLVYCPNTSELIKYYDKTDGITLNNNLLIGSKGVSTDNGCVSGEALMTKVWSVDVPYTTIKAKKLPYVKYDLTGELRIDPVIGALQNKEAKPAVEVATSANCGPQWYTSSAATSTTANTKAPGKTVNVEPGIDNLTKAIKKAGNNDILVLSSGEYVITNKIGIAKDITIKSADSKSKPVIKLQSERDNNCFFEIGGNSRVSFEGVAFNGDSKAKYPAKYVIASAKEGANGYSLFIDNCEIYDVNVATGAIFKAYKGSIADSLKISNSVLRDSYRGISLGEEKEDIGKYSVENLVLDNTVFSNFTQYAMDFYRGGVDESTLGGSLYVDHCVFDNVGADEKQYILKLTNIVKVDIRNSVFSNSMAKTTLRITGVKNSIQNCCFYNCNKPKTESGAQSANIIFDNPKFEKKSFVLSNKSPLISVGTDGKNIGLR